MYEKYYCALRITNHTEKTVECGEVSSSARVVAIRWGGNRAPALGSMFEAPGKITRHWLLSRHYE
jgi:hypothetical protein